MQRIVSGAGIHDLSKYCNSSQHQEGGTANLTRTESENNDPITFQSSPVTFGDAANFVESDGDGEDEGHISVTIDVDDTFTNCSRVRPPQQLGNNLCRTQLYKSGSPSLRIPSNGGDSFSNDQNNFNNATKKQQQTPLSIISGLLPAVDLLPISRHDSRNSGTTTSLGSGLQRSQNSSRDWGWFEDVHHSDQSVTSSTPSSGVLLGHTKMGDISDNERTTIGGSDANKTSSPQHQLRSTGTSNMVYASGLGTNIHVNGRSGIRKPNLTITRIDGSSKFRDTIKECRDSANNDKYEKSSHFHVYGRGDTNDKTTSLLPTGDEMFIDEMQEYLEPVLIPSRPRDMENEAAIQAVTAPNYVLEESLSNQLLWKRTAGNRPPQPVEERAFFEAQWAENFAMSEVEYRMPAEVLTATTPISLNPFADGNFGSDGTGAIGAGGTPVAEVGGTRIGVGNHQDVADMVSSFVVPGGTSGHGVASGHQNPHLQNRHRVVRNSSGSGGTLIVYTKGDNVFGTTVSKSFARPSINGELVSGVDTVNISIASYRVVESERRWKHAQFLVIYREGSIRDTIGVWKRYSDFQELSKKVTDVHEGCASVIANMSPLAMTEEHDVEHLPNAITSWHLLKKRKRWYRCLDSGYLSLKTFLLERFLHDILFESSTPDLLRDFVGVPPPK